MPNIDAKGAIAIIDVLGSFVIVGTYVVRGQAPDPLVLAFVTGALMLVLGFYFGHVNGAATQLANSSTQLATLALQQATTRRAGDVMIPGALTVPSPQP